MTTPKSPLGQCQHAATSDKGVPQCDQDATTRIGGVPLCKEHGDRSAMKPEKSPCDCGHAHIGHMMLCPGIEWDEKHRDDPAPTDKDSSEVAPCPFCGKQPIKYFDENCGAPYPGGYFTIECANEECCIASVEKKRLVKLPGMTWDEGVESIWPEIVAIWNKRVGPEPTNWQARAETAAVEVNFHKKSTAQLYLIAREGFGLDETIGGESCFDYVMRHLGIIRSEISASQAEVERLRALSVRIYNMGYHAGHHDTVEGGYADIFTCDMDTYHNDVVDEFLAEALSPAEKGGAE